MDAESFRIIIRVVSILFGPVLIYGGLRSISLTKRQIEQYDNPLMTEEYKKSGMRMIFVKLQGFKWVFFGSFLLVMFLLSFIYQ